MPEIGRPAVSGSRAMGGLSEYLSKVRTAVTRRNGTQVAALLDVTELAQGNVAAKQVLRARIRPRMGPA